MSTRRHHIGRLGLALAVGLALALALVPTARWVDLAERLPLPRRLQDSLLVWRYENQSYPDTSPAQVGDGRPASEIRLRDPMGVVEDAQGNVFVTDRGHYVWRIDPAGRAQIVAGSGRQGNAAPGGPALRAHLGLPEGVALDHAGRVHFADSRNDSVLRIEADGRLVRVAGSGRRGYGGDGGPAREARLTRPFDVRFGPSGALFIADYGNHRIRRVGTDGVITTVAGSGRPGYTGDGGRAIAARLREPYGIFVDARGRLWIADSGNHVVRRVDEGGIITTVAGTGHPGFAGDGGAAAAGRFDSPQGLFVDAEGQVFVNDEHNRAIRVIRPDGTLDTVVGGPAPSVTSPLGELVDPENVTVRRDGSLLVTDGDRGLVLSISPAGRIEIFAGRRRDPQRRAEARPPWSSSSMRRAMIALPFALTWKSSIRMYAPGFRVSS